MKTDYTPIIIKNDSDYDKIKDWLKYDIDIISITT